MGNKQVIVGLGSCGIAAGAGKVYEKIRALKEVEGLDFELKKTSCVGMCYREPLVEVIDESGSYLYGEIDEARAIEILDKHIEQNIPVQEYVVHSDLFKTVDNTFTDSQVKIALRNCGYMDPENITDYENRDGYAAIKKLRRKASPEKR
jgi:NADH-quinone oxidoreductase subunit F